MEVDENGVPTKEKMSKLTVVRGNGSKNVLGEADLNLCDFNKQNLSEFNQFSLALQNC